MVSQQHPLHETGRNNAPDECPRQADERFHKESLPDHEYQYQHAHAESRAEVRNGNELVLAEIAAEALIFCQRNNGRIIGQEGEHRPQSRHPGKIEEGAHERAQQSLQQAHHTKRHKQAPQCPGEHTDGHEVENRINEQVMRRFHNRIEHGGRPHLPTDTTEETAHHRQTDIARRYKPAETTECTFHDSAELQAISTPTHSIHTVTNE